ncbi:FAD binding domain-containing protein [Trametes polyzona]|nr:FAD binding domain-containing protein [Trametes polyzona]
MTFAPTASSEESNVDVLIIGAGPAGVMAANALVHAGVNVRIIDKRPELDLRGQADGFQSRTQEILQSYGLRERFHAMGNELWRTAYYVPGRDGNVVRTGRQLAVAAEDARYPYGLTLYQGAAENLLIESMKTKGVSVERPTVPTSLKLTEATDAFTHPQAYANTVVLKHLGSDEEKTEVVHAKFVIGTDGAHSWVRKTLGIGAEGSVTGSIWGVVDFRPDTDLPDIRCMTYIQSEQGTLFIIPRERDLVRLYVQQPDDSEVINPNTGRANKNRSSPEKILEQARKLLHPYRMDIQDDHVDWWTIYVVGQRVAEKYSVHDRVLIAGDACHTHSPKAGQGMNAAIGDSHNLAWKLAYVLRGWADLSLLKTYESERRKFAQDLIAFDKKWSKLFTDKPRSESNPNGVTQEQMVSMAKTFAGFMSGIAIVYGPSTIVKPQYEHLAPGLPVGKRVSPQIFLSAASGKPSEIQDLLPADTRFKVLVFGGDLSAPEDAARLQAAADELVQPESFVQRFGHGAPDEIFDNLCFSSAKADTVDYLDFPQFFRPHYSKVFVDDTTSDGRLGGGGYDKYGIDPHAGAIVVVRPDGYVGMIAPLDRVDELTAYFGAFLV